MSIRNDEPTKKDRLSRVKYARAFGKMTSDCETPLVVGLYGTWGIGKTSLMKQIESEVDTSKCCTVWFDAWQHQFDDAPAVALLHEMVNALGIQNEAKKLLSIIAVALTSWGLKKTTGLSSKEVQDIGERWESEHFQIMEARTKLREHFAKIVQLGRGESERKVVFFIDDLDRCLPSTALKLLEALKLFLNLPGCIYFLGVDRHALEQSVRFHYKDTDIREESYLDKIVQLPFHIPPVFPESMEAFVQGSLSKELHGCTKLLASGLGENPREIKRFINAFSFNHALAVEASIEGYDPLILASIQLIQQRDPKLFQRIASNPNSIITIAKQISESTGTSDKDASINPRLHEALKIVALPPSTLLVQYIYLTKLVSVGNVEDGVVRTIDMHAEIASHRLWLDTNSMEGRQANLSDAPLRDIKLEDADLQKALLRNAIMSNSNLCRVDLSSSDAVSANFDDSTLDSVKFNNAELSSASYCRIKSKKSSFNGIKGNKTLFLEAKLSQSDFSDSILDEADFSGAILNSANFSRARLLDTSFCNASLVSAILTDLDLTRVDFNSANLRRATLSQSNLSNNNLANLDLNGAIIEYADLQGADLSGADLTGAILNGSNLSGADLSGTVLLNVDLSNVNGIDQAQYDVAIIDTRKPRKKKKL